VGTFFETQCIRPTAECIKTPTCNAGNCQVTESQIRAQWRCHDKRIICVKYSWTLWEYDA